MFHTILLCYFKDCWDIAWEQGAVRRTIDREEVTPHPPCCKITTGSELSFIFASYVSVAVENVSRWQKKLLVWDLPCRCEKCVWNQQRLCLCVCARYKCVSKWGGAKFHVVWVVFDSTHEQQVRICKVCEMSLHYSLRLFLSNEMEAARQVNTPCCF